MWVWRCDRLWGQVRVAKLLREPARASPRSAVLFPWGYAKTDRRFRVPVRCPAGEHLIRFLVQSTVGHQVRRVRVAVRRGAHRCDGVSLTRVTDTPNTRNDSRYPEYAGNSRHAPSPRSAEMTSSYLCVWLRRGGATEMRRLSG